MEDLEVLCRSCHEAHHQAHRCSRGKKKEKPKVNRQAIFRLLTAQHKKDLMVRFRYETMSAFHMSLTYGENVSGLLEAACSLLGVDGYYGRKVGERLGTPKARQPVFVKIRDHYGVRFVSESQLKKQAALTKSLLHWKG